MCSGLLFFVGSDDLSNKNKFVEGLVGVMVFVTVRGFARERIRKHKLSI
jgi:hypothetical protein